MIELWRDAESVELQTVLDEWDAEAKVPQRATPVLGMQLREVTAEHRKQLGLPEEEGGLLVTEVAVGSPAEEAGIRVGDRITEAAQMPVTTVEAFRTLVGERTGTNKSILVRYARGDSNPDITVIKVP